ncbi:hypothetical protein SAY87_014796 [Trapa incisa]|uniref:Alpha 1,4-glycosyltransferase domain-containing protein n=1 Tax=Trapa incisa TaxID=236973 RepID=A0AAN7JLE1_9MYRT|nr:hypothetical protein SAY87_014796 [Trapa incisa]
MKRDPHYAKRSSQKMSFRRLIHLPYIPIFSAIFFALMIIYADNIISNLSPNSMAIRSIELLNLIPSNSVTESINITHPPAARTHTATLLPPQNSTREERIAWLMKNLPEFNIFQRTKSDERFHDGVVEFFGDSNCRTRFFMTWLLPANQFGSRELICIGSLFKAHPSGCLLIISGSMDSTQGNKILEPLIEKGFRVVPITPNLPFLVNNTPAKAWLEEMKSGKRDPGLISLGQNLSNLIRLAILYKYGGIYMDTDFIVLRKFDGLTNTIGAQTIRDTSLTLNNAVLVFEPEHPLVYKFLEEFATTFNGNKWGFNGPFLVTRVVKRLQFNGNFTVLPPEAFYPVDWIRIGRLFRSPRNKREAQWVEDEATRLDRVAYGVHLWNKRSRSMKIEEGSVMEKLVAKYCAICMGKSGSRDEMSE